MCGIAGIVTVDGRAPPTAALAALSDALAHRGPDGAATRICGGVGLAHRRLAVIDLATGDQPLVGPDGLGLVANGEIYNHLELKRDLLRLAPFATRSDCEVVLHLYRAVGLDFVQHLRGMYALAMHDPATDTVILARDPFGIKPLYYTQNSELFAFASEPQALIAAGLSQARIEDRALGELMQLNFTTGADTIFAGVHRLLPGELICVRGGRIIERRQTPALPDKQPRRLDDAQALEQYDALFRDSVEIHQRSDVPYGLFLSGGMDSRSILAAMAKHGAERVLAYTASFPEVASRDEYPRAQQAAGLFGAAHVKVEVTHDHFWRLSPSAIAAMDDPVADPAVLPTYVLAAEARKDVKVVLCGEGADELFAGYSRYGRQARPGWLGGRERRRRGPFSDAGVLREERADWRTGLALAQHAVSDPGRTRLQIAQALDMADFLPHGLLTKLDRPLMAHGLEGRTPFLDLPLGRFGFDLPNRLKLRRGRGKYLVRAWLSKQAPQDDCFARKKGFTPPYAHWVRQSGDTLGPLVAADPFIQALCLPGAAQALFVSDEPKRQELAWRLMFLALWHRRHVRGMPSDGDLAECLAQKG